MEAPSGLALLVSPDPQKFATNWIVMIVITHFPYPKICFYPAGPQKTQQQKGKNNDDHLYSIFCHSAGKIGNFSKFKTK